MYIGGWIVKLIVSQLTNFQINSELTDQFEMSWECFSQGVSTARVVDVAWVKSHLLKTDLNLNIIYQSWVASDDCQDKRCILQKCRRSPHSRERETCNRKAAPENQYISFSFLLFLLILILTENQYICFSTFSSHSHFCFLLCEHPGWVLPVCEWLSSTAAEATLERGGWGEINVNEGKGRW